MNTNPCRCGCGHMASPGRTFVKGHAMRHPDVAARVGQTARRIWGTDDGRNEIIATLAADRRYNGAEIGRLFGISRQRVEQLLRSKEHGARQAVVRALSLGQLIRPGRCSVCRRATDVQAHHANYNRPLDVEWLCTTCHAAADKRDGRRGKPDGVLVRWRCRGCGELQFGGPMSARRGRFCSADCKHAFFASREPVPYRGPDGHLWVALPTSNKRVRAERWVAMKALGRELTSREWVVLVDGNPENLDPSNVLVLTPTQVMAIRDGRATPFDFTPVTSKAA